MKTIRFFLSLLVCMVLGGSMILRAAESTITVDNQTGYILSKDNPNEKRQIGSLTKIATAMVVLDWVELSRSDLAAPVIVPAQAISAGGVNPLGFMTGDQITLRDLLYSALMASDNVAAYTLAYHVGAKLPNPKHLDPLTNFVAQMNALARFLSMKRTLFLNPAGIDNMEGTLPYSTAADVARLTRYAYLKASFRFYVSQQSREIHVNRAGQQVSIPIQNTNQLLGRESIDGVKTGRTSHAGDCIVLSSEHPPESRHQGDQVLVTPKRVIVVLLGSPDRLAEGLGKIRAAWTIYDQWAAKGRPAHRSDSL